MSRSRRRGLIALAGAIAVAPFPGCGGDVQGDAAAARDAAVADAADGGDASLTDGSLVDASAPLSTDGSIADALVADARTVDGTTFDATTVDASFDDADRADATAPDAASDAAVIDGEPASSDAPVVFDAPYPLDAPFDVIGADVQAATNDASAADNIPGDSSLLDGVVPALPQGFVEVAISAGTTGSCSQAGWELVLIGSNPTSPDQEPIRTPGSALDTISCSVDLPDGSAYAVTADVSHNPQPDGQGAVTFSASVAPSGSASPVNAYFDLGADVYTSSGCTITTPYGFALTTAQPPTSPGAGSVEPGRIWGELRCENAPSVASGDVCTIVADFVLENCSPF